MAPKKRKAARVIAVSPHIAEQAIQLGVKPSRLRLIRSGVDVERFRPRDRAAARQRLGFGGETPLVLFVGNLEPRKQVDVLLRAMAQLRQELPDALLVVVGSGQNAGVQDQTAHLMRLARELELDEAVLFAGRATDEQLMDYYAAADVFALPSSSEAQGIVALEAMACELTVVATAVGGLVGTIDDGRTGFLVPSGEVAALADVLVEVLPDAARRRAIGRAARERVKLEFSWSRSIEATLDVYREMLS
jgi:glycosyltransferase involved in cell wall biosynthesis